MALTMTRTRYVQSYLIESAAPPGQALAPLTAIDPVTADHRERLTRVADRYLAACGVEELDRKRLIREIIETSGGGAISAEEGGRIDMCSLQSRIDRLLAQSGGASGGDASDRPGWGRLCRYWGRGARPGEWPRHPAPQSAVDMPVQDLSPPWARTRANGAGGPLRKAARVATRLALLIVSSVGGGR